MDPIADAILFVGLQLTPPLQLNEDTSNSSAAKTGTSLPSTELKKEGNDIQETYEDLLDVALFLSKFSPILLQPPKLIANKALNISSSEREVMRKINEDLAVLKNHLEDIGMLSNISENLREYMRWVDEKTERRWWLTDFIQFLQIFIKLALFVSAAVTVAYHEEQTAPITTLAITVLQGVVELLDQFFVRKLKPRQVQLSFISINRPVVA